jgi:hypothetical protein
MHSPQAGIGSNSAGTHECQKSTVTAKTRVPNVAAKNAMRVAWRGAQGGAGARATGAAGRQTPFFAAQRPAQPHPCLEQVPISARRDGRRTSVRTLPNSSHAAPHAVAGQNCGGGGGTRPLHAVLDDNATAARQANHAAGCVHLVSNAAALRPCRVALHQYGAARQQRKRQATRLDGGCSTPMTSASLGSGQAADVHLSGDHE